MGASSGDEPRPRVQEQPPAPHDRDLAGGSLVPPALPYAAAGPAPASLTTRVVLWSSIAIAAVVFAMSSLSTTENTPAHALVVIDARARVYTTPACAFTVRPVEPSVATKAEAERRGYVPEPVCLRAGGFLGAGDSKWNAFLKRVFRTPPSPSRWRADGTWRW